MLRSQPLISKTAAFLLKKKINEIPRGASVVPPQL